MNKKIPLYKNKEEKENKLLCHIEPVSPLFPLDDNWGLSLDPNYSKEIHCWECCIKAIRNRNRNRNIRNIMPCMYNIYKKVSCKHPVLTEIKKKADFLIRIREL